MSKRYQSNGRLVAATPLKQLKNIKEAEVDRIRSAAKNDRMEWSWVNGWKNSKEKSLHGERKFVKCWDTNLRRIEIRHRKHSIEMCFRFRQLVEPVEPVEPVAWKERIWGLLRWRNLPTRLSTILVFLYCAFRLHSYSLNSFDTQFCKSYYPQLAIATLPATHPIFCWATWHSVNLS